MKRAIISTPLLIPQPRRLKPRSGLAVCRLPRVCVLVASAHLGEDDRFAIDLLGRTLRDRAQSRLNRTEKSSRGARDALRIEWKNKRRPAAPAGEAYRLEIDSDRIVIEASSAKGRYYAVQTLRQLLIQYGSTLPRLQIDDEPDFAHRGFMHDVSRGKVPRLKTLFELIELLGFLKYNHLQLYIEHTFAFRRHPLIGRGHSPLTGADLLKLDEHCRRHHIEFVPNLQSFGHAHHTLIHPRYRRLAESDFRDGWTLSPEEPGTYDLLAELYEEFLRPFSHRLYFNVGCDETWDLGRGKSAARARREGIGRVYLGHLLRVRRLVRRHGYRMMFWGDIIAHHPELLPEIPRDVIVLNWEYEARGGEKQYRQNLAPARRSGLEHWICPGASSWNSLFFRMSNARANLRDSARAGRWAGAAGYLVTDWGDAGHYNFLSFSLWPIAYGADCAWRVNPNPKAEENFDRRFALQVLADPAGRWIGPLRLMGELYKAFGVELANNSPERWLLTGYPDPDPLGMTGELEVLNRIERGGLERALRGAEHADEALGDLHPLSAPLGAVRAEWRLGARMAAHACRRALWCNHGRGDPRKLKKEIQTLARRFEALWLARNRRSDLAANMADLRRVAGGYDHQPPRRIVF